MKQTIIFGTDGWRGVIADDFTFENLSKVALATAKYLKKHPRSKNGVIVGYDARFLSREFAERTAEVLANHGLPVTISDAISSTPMVSLLAKTRKAAGGVMITASHNPAKYNGYKLKGDFGGPAHPEMIAQLEKKLKKVMKSGVQSKKSFAELVAKKKIKPLDFTSAYVEDVKSKIDLGRIREAGMSIAFDAMNGSGQGVLQRLVPVAVAIRNDFNPSFGGSHPEPLAHNLIELSSAVVERGCSIGIATDGDADRVGAMDERGQFVDSHRIFALLLKYLVEVKGWSGEVAKSFSVSKLIDKMCEKYGLRLHETPVGFKHLCRLMTERDILIAAEESGGLGVKGHIPERDGIYIGLLLCEMMTVRGKPLSALVEELMEEFGWHYYNRYDAHLTPKEKERILAAYRKGVRRIGGMEVLDVETIDGIKLIVKGGWVLVRASGTEPLIRFYAEADTPETVERLLRSAREI